MKNISQPYYLKNYIRSEFSRLKSDNIFWFGTFILSAIVIIIRVVSLFFISYQLIDQAGRIVPFSERMPLYLSLIQSNFDMAPIMYVLFLFVFPLVNSILYASSISFERKYGVSKTISIKLPVHIYYIGKLIMSAIISLLLFLYLYLFDTVLALIIYPINGTGYFNFTGKIFSNTIFSIYVNKIPENQYLFFIGIMFISALVFALYSTITCSLVFLTRLKYPAIVLSTMMIGIFSSIILDVASMTLGLPLRNFAIGRLSYFFFHSNQGVSPLMGILVYILAVSILVLCTYRYLKKAGDIY